MIKKELIEISENRIFIVTVVSWITAQTIKVMLGVFQEKRFNFRWFVGTGGMPSSHAAMVAALASSVGLTFGFDSALFTITAIFALIVIFDAQGVRRSSGQQAEVLNKILDDIYWKHRIQEDRLKEFLGHTPVQVIVGTLIGIIISLLFYHKRFI